MRIIFRLACVQTPGGVCTLASVCRSRVVKLEKKCDLLTPFELSEEKQTKMIYTIVYRNTINVSDSQIACVKTPPPLKK